LGHPSLINKLLTPLKNDDLQVQVKTEKISKILVSKTQSFDLMELAPEVFKTIRKIYAIDE